MMSNISGVTNTATAVGQGQPRLSIDRIRCDAHGMCAELLPEVIELDDWGYPIVQPGGVPQELLEHARRAVAVCPVLALALRGTPR
jgi:ferredoxin